MQKWNEVIEEKVAKSILDDLLYLARQRVYDWKQCTPPSDCATYLDALYYYKGKFILQFNDEFQCTKTVQMEWKGGIEK